MNVAVVGGGPAGLIAAELVAEHGYDVTVFDRRRSVARKFVLAGRGGLNITNAEPFERFLERYGPDAVRLRPALEAFDPAALAEWCERRGEATFVGSSGRVFPRSFRGVPLLRTWLADLAAMGVRFETGHTWLGWAGVDRTALRFEQADGTERLVSPDAVIFALGGASWPRVGGDGGWVQPFRAAGIEVRPLRAANCGVQVAWSDHFRDRFAGVPVKNATFSLDHAVHPDGVRGDAVITVGGLEGGPIYAHSRGLRSRLDTGETPHIVIDLFPDLDHGALTLRLSKRRPKASVSTWLRTTGLHPLQIGLLRESTGNKPPNDPAEMAELLKALPLPVAALNPIERAISSAGGVAWSELTDDFMLRALPGTFAAGEMLDWEAPTGGYLLQGCFSTGAAAARGVIDWLDAQARM